MAVVHCPNYGQTTGEAFDSDIYDYGTETTIAECPSSWTNTGYKFDGWHQRQDGDTSYSKDYAAGEKYTGPTMTLYAQWVEDK